MNSLARCAPTLQPPFGSPVHQALCLSKRTYLIQTALHISLEPLIRHLPLQNLEFFCVFSLQVTKVVIPPSRPDKPNREFGFVHFSERSVVEKLVQDAEKGTKPSLDSNTLEVHRRTSTRPLHSRRLSESDAGCCICAKGSYSICVQHVDIWTCPYAATHTPFQ